MMRLPRVPTHGRDPEEEGEAGPGEAARTRGTDMPRASEAEDADEGGREGEGSTASSTDATPPRSSSSTSAAADRSTSHSRSSSTHRGLAESQEEVSAALRASLL